MNKLNKNNADNRDIILFGEPYSKEKYYGGCRRFFKMKAESYEKLLGLNVIDPNGTQNGSPTAEEIYQFAKDHPSFTIHGYAISPERDDYRVTFEGVEGNFSSVEELADFAIWFRCADEFEINGNFAYCWFD